MTDLIPQPLPERTEYPNRLRRMDRKMIRSNRALASKGILVNPGENIQAAIDSVDKESGGIVTLVSGTHIVAYNITIPSFVTLQGEGRDGTIIDFNDGNFNITSAGGASPVLNMRLRDVTIKQSGASTAAVDINYAESFILDNVRFTDNAASGLRVIASQNYTVFNCLADTNVSHGYSLVSIVGNPHIRFNFIGSKARDNGGSGFILNVSGAGIVKNGAFVACEADDNTSHGFSFTGANISTYLTNCVADGNDGNGFNLAAQFISMVACTAQSNNTYGVNNTDNNNMVLGCNIQDNNEDFQSTTDAVSVIGNSLKFGPTIAIKDTFLTGDAHTISMGNTGGNTRTEKSIMRMKNTSGGTIDEGDVVVFKAVANGDEVTTTTTQGDDFVFGMSLETSENNEYGAILVEGHTTELKVSGTTDIAIGDFLGTHTTAARAMKAAAGDMAFAIALEAYTTDDVNGVINALLVKPRKI